MMRTRSIKMKITSAVMCIFATVLPLALFLYGCAGTKQNAIIDVERESVSAPPFVSWGTVRAAPTLRYALSADNTDAHLIPESRRGSIKDRTYGKGTSTAYFYFGEGCIRNYTKIPNATAAAEAAKDVEIAIELYGEPQVLIYHTHATESFDRYDVGYYDSSYPARSTDNSMNMVSVGAIVAEILNANGITTVQSDTQHDYPQYNGSYGRSRKTIEEYLKRYPSIKIVLDLHRDALISGNVRYKPIVTIDGVKAAQIMIISGADNGSMNMPNFYHNLRLAARIQDTAERMYPGITRPVMFDYRSYNQNTSKGALLIEIGSHANTLEEAQYTGELLGYILSATFLELVK